MEWGKCHDEKSHGSALDVRKNWRCLKIRRRPLICPCWKSTASWRWRGESPVGQVLDHPALRQAQKITPKTFSYSFHPCIVDIGPDPTSKPVTRLIISIPKFDNHRLGTEPINTFVSERYAAMTAKPMIVQVSGSAQEMMLAQRTSAWYWSCLKNGVTVGLARWRKSTINATSCPGSRIPSSSWHMRKNENSYPKLVAPEL